MWSEEELDFVANQDLLLIKNRIISKLETLFTALEIQLRPKVQEYAWPKGCNTTNGKISRGENYNGLPYMVLDYPRYKNKDAYFLYRLLFFWGQGFQAQLHLKDAELIQKFQSHVPKTLLQQKPLYLNTSISEEWNHQTDSPSTVALQSIAQLQKTELPFIKITKPFPLHAVEEVKEGHINLFLALFKFLEAK